MTWIRPSLAALAALFSLAGCGDGQRLFMGEGAQLYPEHGNLQQVVVGQPSRELSVILRDVNGISLVGITVHWSVTSGGGTVAPLTALTSINGVARATYTADSVPGRKTVVATVSGLPPMIFTLFAVPVPPAQ